MNLFKKTSLLAAIAGAMLVAPLTATALTEDFEASFPTWESGWLGTNSNMQNYYGVGQGRGNNPDGLWIADNISGVQSTYINFTPAFGATITSLSFDLTSWVNLTLQIFDSSNVILGSWAVSPTYGAYSDPGNYINYSVSSTTGVGGFRLLNGGNGQIEGNTSIDNVVVNGGGHSVPDGSSTVLLCGLGIAMVAAMRRRLAA